MRGEVESVGFIRRDLKWEQATCGEACRGKARGPLPPPPPRASAEPTTPRRGAEGAELWRDYQDEALNGGDARKREMCAARRRFGREIRDEQQNS